MLRKMLMVIHNQASAFRTQIRKINALFSKIVNIKYI